MNMMYSDYFKTAKKYEHQNDAMFFAELAKEWMTDSDAPADKTYRYYFYVVCTC